MMDIIGEVYIIQRMEEKLLEYMGKEEYEKFSDEVAKGAFRHYVDMLEDGDLKSFCEENFDEIVEMEKCNDGTDR